MGRKVTPDDLREMLKLAAMLRASATRTKNQSFIDLFLRAAMALEERASLLSTDNDADENTEVELRPSVDFLC